MNVYTTTPRGSLRHAPKLRPLGVGLILALAAALAPAPPAKKKARRLPPPPADLPGHLNYLAKQLPGVPVDESEPITSQIQKLVLDHLGEWFNQHPPSAEPVETLVDVPYDVKVRRELEYAFSQLHYPLIGQPAVFARAWRGAQLIGASYTLGWTDQNRVNVVALYESRDRKTRLAALTHFVRGPDLHYEFPAPPLGSGHDDFWALVYGSRLGKSHPRLTAVLYAFDGHSLTPLWKAQDVYDGHLNLNGQTLVIRYMREDEFIRATEQRAKPPHREAVYRLTASGLELESDREVE